MADNRKRVLLYNWGSTSHLDLLQKLQERDDLEVQEISLPFTNYDNDDVFAETIENLCREKPIQICMSFNYFPFISRACQEKNILYISWVYDCPHPTLYSKTRSNNCNLIFLFDRAQTRKIQQLGSVQVFHLPLAANIGRLDALCSTPAGADASYLAGLSHSVSFVGTLYEKNLFQQINYLPPHLEGYLEGICSAQMSIYGESILENLLDETTLAELQKYVTISIDDAYDMTYREMFLDSFLKKYIASQERKTILSELGQIAPVTLFSDSPWNNTGIENRGVVDYRTQMPLVFRHSALNLNLSIRSIASGIPLRCIDIMGSRGALLSNPQEELLEYFTPDTDFVTFQSREELLEKAAYYMPRESKRMEIAKNGFEKIRKYFTYETALDKIFQIANSYL